MQRIRAEIRAFNQTIRREVALTSATMGKAGAGRRGARHKLGARGTAVVRRLYPGPAYMDVVLREISSRSRARYWRALGKEKHGYMLQMLALYWADGTRTIDEIVKLVAAELGYTNAEFIRLCFDLLEEAGFVALD